MATFYSIHYPYLTSMKENGKVRCCFCDYTSTERGVEAHMGKAHKDILIKRQRVVGWGRLPKDACSRCGMIHQRIPRDGSMADRRKLERSGKVIKSAFVFGRIPQGYQGRGEKLHLATLTPPKGTTSLTPMFFSSEATPSEFHITASGKEYTFEVDQGVVRRIRVRKVA